METIRSIWVDKKVKPLGYDLWGRGRLVQKDFTGKIGFELYFKGKKDQKWDEKSFQGERKPWTKVYSQKWAVCLGTMNRYTWLKSRIYVEELWEIYVMWIRVTLEKVWIIENVWAEGMTDTPVFMKYTSKINWHKEKLCIMFFLQCLHYVLPSVTTHPQLSSVVTYYFWPNLIMLFQSLCLELC